WDFGDTASGGNNTSTLQNPSHPFSAAGSYSVTLTTVSDGGCASVITYTVTVTAVGIEEFIYDQVSIFPNPTADGIINIQLSADLFKGASLRVFDVYGELILSRTIARQGSEMVNLSNQSAGVYMINIATDHGTVTKRIVIF
ncbi:MAG: T9SS type A sorting domain-containing protein, partial [Flavobacteriales bacterium]|nr:T9SS type A sorting domain-containing protein [Flavobacteriales bacterium]